MHFRCPAAGLATLKHVRSRAFLSKLEDLLHLRALTRISPTYPISPPLLLCRTGAFDFEPVVKLFTADGNATRTQSDPPQLRRCDYGLESPPQAAGSRMSYSSRPQLRPGGLERCLLLSGHSNDTQLDWSWSEMALHADRRASDVMLSPARTLLLRQHCDCAPGVSLDRGIDRQP